MPQTELATKNQELKTDLRNLADDIVRRAMAGGATAAECVVREGDEFSTLVRLGQVETLKEAGSRFIGGYRRSYCSVAAVPIAQAANGGMQRDYWFSVARNLGRLDSPEEVG